MPIDEARFKLAMSHFASGVTIVTTEHGGKPYGMTVASFASLSLRPPLVVVCIEKTVKSHDAISAARQFGVSILSEDQTEISNRFASRTDDKFSGTDVRTLAEKLGISPKAAESRLSRARAELRRELVVALARHE